MTTSKSNDINQKKYNCIFDGLDPLLKLFINEDEFLTHFFSNVKFFKPEIVEIQSRELLNKIENEIDNPIPVRFSMKSKKYFYFKNETTNSGTSKRSFKNKSDAQSFNSNQELFHKETDIKVCIDKDGNYYVRKEILNAIDFKVSQGLTSDIKNYMICHIWGETSNPLFFTSLWNIALIPNYLSFITDKPDENSQIVRIIKNTLKAISIELYNPNKLLNRNVISYSSFETDLARKYIENGTIQFIDKKSNKDFKEVCFSKKQIIPEENMDNKAFIISQLVKLAGVDESLIEILTCKEECKNKFDIYFPILKEFDLSSDESTYKDDLGKQRYYKKNTFFENDNKKYIICNHWFPRQRELFELWVYDNINLEQ
ncbi:MAG: hypothetical protein WCH34_11405 [Bacteroidota bacterium]